MAKKQKKEDTPVGLKVPKALLPIMEAFNQTSRETVISLMSESQKILFGFEENGVKALEKAGLSKKEVKEMASIIMEIKPKDDLERIYSAQMVISHMLGLRKLSFAHPRERVPALKFLRFSQEGLAELIEKQAGNPQNITEKSKESDHACCRS